MVYPLFLFMELWFYIVSEIKSKGNEHLFTTLCKACS